MCTCKHLHVEGDRTVDPNATLREIRWLLSETPNDAHLLALRWGAVQAHVEALDDWLSKGGFLPTEWSEGRN
jgi:hypothetical protein